MLNLASITLTSSRASIIGDALQSVVNWVDASILIDLGIEDETVEVARSIFGRRLHVVPYDWSYGPYCSNMRNFGLSIATAMDFNRAVTVDTDERIHPGQCRIREGLFTTQDDCIEVPSLDERYHKERFFRLPFPGQFVGKAHEYVPATSCKKSRLDIVTFTELPKTPEQIRSRSLSILPVILEEISDHPEEERWYFYLGDTLMGLHRYEEATKALRQCIAMCKSGNYWNIWSKKKLASIPKVIMFASGF